MRISDWSSDVCSSDLFDAITISGVALRVGDRDVAGRDDLAGFAVPDDLIGAQPIVAAEHPHVAARGDDIGIHIVFERSRGKLDRVRLIGRPLLGRRRVRAILPEQLLRGRTAAYPRRPNSKRTWRAHVGPNG